MSGNTAGDGGAGGPGGADDGDGGPGGDGSAGGAGGGIFNNGTLTLSKCTLNGNTAGLGGLGGAGTPNGDSGWPNSGGGIAGNEDIVLDQCTVNDNHTLRHGGGVYQGGASALITVTNSTFSGNSAGVNGGGLCVYNGGRIENSTFTNNTSDTDDEDNGLEGGGGIGLYTNGTLQIRNTIIVGNYRGGASPVDDDCIGTMVSEGYNLIVSGNGCPDNGATDVALTDPAQALLESLADNGGATWTHAILAASPAINAGSCTDIDGDEVTEDQRGVLRPQMQKCDIGAVEYGYVLVIAVTDEPDGPNCSHGGKRIETGWDRSFDAVLDPDEVRTTDYVCNGASGAEGEEGSPGADGDDGAEGQDGAPGADGSNALVDIDEEPAGENCPAGGYRIATGLDLDQSGALEASEVDDTYYVCNGATGAEGGQGADGVQGEAGEQGEAGCGCGVIGNSGSNSLPFFLMLVALAALLRRRA